MISYQELLRENDYLKACLNLDHTLYAVCICVKDGDISILGCVKFMNGTDHWRSRDKMFSNISGKKYWALVEKDVYKKYNKGRDSFVVKSKER